MKIAIQAADLDAKRIDGTRIYIWNLLKLFGKIDQKSHFFIYHRKKFNPELTFPDFSNYQIIQKDFPFLWTQTRFALELKKNQPEILWMPIQALPIIKNKNLKTVVTIHDLAFKYFPKSFPVQDLRKLSFFTSYAIRHTDKIIAVSESTKKDILKFYPEVKESKIKVIYHGFDPQLFQKDISKKEIKKVHTKYNILNTKYLLYVGAMQPRKNLLKVVSAFEIVKKAKPDLKLVIAGEKAWLWKDILEKIKKSLFQKDIITPGKVSFKDLIPLYQGASIFLFPSLYEGFGLPILEAQASQIPVITSNNSSLPEIMGDGGILVNPQNEKEIAQAILKIESNPQIKKDLIKKGLQNLNKFSWEKCARETLNFLKS